MIHEALLAAPGNGGTDLSAFATAHYPFFSRPSFAPMTTPALVVMGDQDVSPHLTVRGADWYANPYHLSTGPKSLLTLFGGGHLLGGVSGYDAKETTDENPERVALVAQLTAAYLRTALYPEDTSWAKASQALRDNPTPGGRIESKEKFPTPLAYPNGSGRPERQPKPAILPAFPHQPLPMPPAENPVYQTLRQQYQDLGWPLDLLDKKLDFTIFDLADLPLPLPLSAPAGRLNFFVFGFIKDAYGTYGVDEERFDLRPNTIYFTNPGHYRSFVYEELEEAFLITLTEGFLKESVHADIFGEFPFLLTETLPALTLPPERFAVFERLCQQLAHEYRQESPLRQPLIGHLFVVLLLKFKEEFGLQYNARHEGSRRSAIVRHFRRDLEQHYRELVHGQGGAVRRVADYAAAQHLHPTYLSTVIKSKTGKTIGTWIAEKTIAEAKSLLRHSAVSVKEIAYRLGFAEPAHFSNYFRKHARQTPSAYRRHEPGGGA